MPGFITPFGHGNNPLLPIILHDRQAGIRPAFVESITISGKTTVLSVEGGPYADPTTIITITSMPTGELEFVHPTGMWGPFDTDNGQL
jgi:hypothetical protein